MTHAIAFVPPPSPRPDVGRADATRPRKWKTDLLPCGVSVAADDCAREQIFSSRSGVSFDEQEESGSHANSVARRLYDRFADDHALLLYVERDRRIAGSIRLNLDGISPLARSLDDVYRFSSFGALPRTSFAVASRFAIHREHRREEVPQLLALATFAIAVENGAMLSFMHSSISLTRYFGRWGFRTYTTPFYDPLAGYRVPMVLMMLDTSYLHRIGSPFAPYAEEARLMRTASERQAFDALAARLR